MSDRHSRSPATAAAPLLLLPPPPPAVAGGAVELAVDTRGSARGLLAAMRTAPITDADEAPLGEPTPTSVLLEEEAVALALLAELLLLPLLAQVPSAELGQESVPPIEVDVGASAELGHAAPPPPPPPLEVEVRDEDEGVCTAIAAAADGEPGPNFNMDSGVKAVNGKGR